MSEVNRVVNVLNEAIQRIVISISTNVTAELIDNTPVDTGWARANWVPQIGAPFAGNSRVLSDDERRSAVGGQRSRQSSAVSGLFNYNVTQGAIFITNNVPYIVRLNEGSSQKAPAGFVQQAIRDGITGIASARFA